MGQEDIIGMPHLLISSIHETVEFAKILFLNAKKLEVLDTLLTLNE